MRVENAPDPAWEAVLGVWRLRSSEARPDGLSTVAGDGDTLPKESRPGSTIPGPDCPYLFYPSLAAPPPLSNPFWLGTPRGEIMRQLMWIGAMMVLFLMLGGTMIFPASAQEEHEREPACVLRLHDPNTVKVSVDRAHLRQENACRNRYGAGGANCVVQLVNVFVSGGVAGTTVTVTGKCGAGTLSATATSPGGAGAGHNNAVGPTAKGNPADCVVTVNQPGGGLLSPTLSFDVLCLFVDP